MNDVTYNKNKTRKEIIISVLLCGTLFCMPFLELGQATAAEIQLNEASGLTVLSNGKAKIDASNTKDGYIMAKYTGGKDLAKLRVTCQNGHVYNYDLRTDGAYESFPLQEGKGKYTVSIHEHTTGKKYAVAYSTTIDVVSMNENGAFLHPNQYVNYNAKTKCVGIASELVKDKKTDLEKVQAIYEYTINTLTYDKEKAATVQSGYLPDLDKVLEAKKGICFDYAAMMTAMLRSQGVPAKLIIGYSGKVYHAWINTYTKEEGWIEGTIFFDGKNWKLMDPTFASSAKSSAKIMEYIGNGDNYTEKYFY